MESFSPLISSNFTLSKPPFSRFVTPKPHSYCVPIRAYTDMSNIRTYWNDIMSDVKLELETSVPSRSPVRMYKAMRHAIFSRKDDCLPSSVLCVAASELTGAPREAALPTAATLEIFHAAIHAHNDLYSMEMRENDEKHPSLGKIYGLDVTLLSGQALLALGFQLITSKTISHYVPHVILTRVIMEIARSMGSTGMYAGQYLDIDSKPLTEEKEVMLVLEKKFGEMAGCSALCGGLIGGAKESELEALRRYGKMIGVLYEMRNEVLMESNVGLRKKNRNVSMVKFLGIERILEIVEELRGKAEGELEMFGEKYGDKVKILYGFLDLCFGDEYQFRREGKEEDVIL